MNLFRISSRIAGAYSNFLSDAEIRVCNRDLYDVTGSDISKILSKHDLYIKPTKGKSGYKRTLYFKGLGIPVRNAYGWLENGRFQISKKKRVQPFNQRYMERVMGPFTVDPDEDSDS
jgi:hypothetical protein